MNANETAIERHGTHGICKIWKKQINYWQERWTQSIECRLSQFESSSAFRLEHVDAFTRTHCQHRQCAVASGIVRHRRCALWWLRDEKRCKAPLSSCFRFECAIVVRVSYTVDLIYFVLVALSTGDKVHGWSTLQMNVFSFYLHILQFRHFGSCGNWWAETIAKNNSAKLKRFLWLSDETFGECEREIWVHEAGKNVFPSLSLIGRRWEFALDILTRTLTELTERESAHE